ncbi:MAG: 2-amino-4-hydroxy-6-hydroxymethyldihydropteridine diphosphokinase [Methylophilaceae bacterium]|nr:2-amino-4-hydroxy-6-hydroxymethyldihydropteridine diphosphokinase [Methylophilaceae bacterium]
MSARAFVALGSNLKDPATQIVRAFDQLALLPATRLLRRSSLYRSAPVGYIDQPDFINAAAELETDLMPLALLHHLLQIEARAGRTRPFPNAPRVLDLDLLLYDALVMHTPELILPHPRLHERVFVLLPLAEIAPDLDVPGHGSLARLLAACPSQGVERLGSKLA